MRLIIISNRLPFTATVESQNVEFHDSVGGLVTGLQAYLNKVESEKGNIEYLWLGWPGTTPDDYNVRQEITKRAASEYNAVPVFVDNETMQQSYHGLCNKTLWPLFHYFPSHTVLDDELWEPYRAVNEAFCDAVSAVIRPGDVVWVHDYHLMLLPRLLRQRFPKLSIGFFLHIPFPSFELFRMLPHQWRIDLLEGLLGADLVGFHTYDYTQYFLRCVNRMLGLDHDMGRIVMDDRIVKADTFPMGIEFERFNEAHTLPEVIKEHDELLSQLTGLKVILSIDRLDYTKGIARRLEGYREYLRRNSEMQGKVVLLCVVVPSRAAVESYHLMKKKVDEIVGEINGAFGTVNWTPIIYQYRQLSFHSMATIYGVSDVALVTPVRDGMNLIAKEYLAARPDGTGVLILSEMAGAAQELSEAILINPNIVEEIATGIEQALRLTREEQIERNLAMRERLQDYDVTRWAEDFLNVIGEVRQAHAKFESRFLTNESRRDLCEAFKRAKSRLVLVDYDNTLVPFVDHPEFAKPTKELIQNLVCWTTDPTTEIVLVSGRDRAQIQEWFSELNIGLAAEHGAWLRPRNSEWSLLKPLVNGWKNGVRPILKAFVSRLPGSFIEEKENSMAWHYRRSASDVAAIRSRELTDDLMAFTANLDTQILQGDKVVEIRNGGVNKGMAGLYWLSQRTYDFVLAIGDDLTDEDLFKALPPSAYTIKVGTTNSHARYNLRDHREVHKLLNQLIEQSIPYPECSFG